MNALVNPFVRVAGTRSLLMGWAAILLTALIASRSHCHLDGVLDAHLSSGTSSAWRYLLDPAISWGIAVIVFYIAGLIVAPSGLRFIDIAGTLALARWPMIFVVLLFFIPINVSGDSLPAQMPSILLGLASLVFIIWVVVLMYHAFSVSSGAKGSRKNIAFTVALIVSEIISKVLLYQLAQHL